MYITEMHCVQYIALFSVSCQAYAVSPPHLPRQTHNDICAQMFQTHIPASDFNMCLMWKGWYEVLNASLKNQTCFVTVFLLFSCFSLQHCFLMPLLTLMPTEIPFCSHEPFLSVNCAHCVYNRAKRGSLPRCRRGQGESRGWKGPSSTEQC